MIQAYYIRIIIIWWTKPITEYRRSDLMNMMTCPESCLSELVSSSLISTLHVLYLRLLCVLYVFHTCFIRVSNSWPLSGCTVILILAESALSLASSRELHTWCHELNNNISCKQHKKRTWNPQNTRKQRVLVPCCYKRYDTTLQTQSTIVKFPKAKEIRTAAGRGTRDVSSHIFPGLKYPVLTEW